ncbi:MAG: hypothetical protein KGI80_03685 [Verrucomicrobiota bacterium]|nr:hypothetical protein [Verrucomicrobiota bacterium]
MSLIIASFFFFSSLAAALPMSQGLAEPQIAMRNCILCQVNGTTISVMDVKKQMDLLFLQRYSSAQNMAPARYQFYETSWRRVLMDLVDNELILADAESKEVKLSDGDIREEMEARFGPNILSTLDPMGLSYEEAWKLIKKEMLVQRMSWWFIHAKALQGVTPGDIRKAYRLHLEANPSYQDYTYQILSVRAEKSEEVAEKLSQLLQDKKETPETLREELLAALPSLQISSSYTLPSKQMAEPQKELLASLSPGQYSAPFLQQKDQAVVKIFYLIGKEDHPAPSFEEMAPSLRNELLQKMTLRESQKYVSKLRNHYGVDPESLTAHLPKDFHPFSLQ